MCEFIQNHELITFLAIFNEENNRNNKNNARGGIFAHEKMR